MIIATLATKWMTIDLNAVPDAFTNRASEPVRCATGPTNRPAVDSLLLLAKQRSQAHIDSLLVILFLHTKYTIISNKSSRPCRP